jgi:hypothetical protein
MTEGEKDERRTVSRQTGGNTEKMKDIGVSAREDEVCVSGRTAVMQDTS